MIVDAHQHFWAYHPQTQDWISEEMSAIRRSFLPADLAPVLQVAGVDATVLVQAEQTAAETAWMLSVAAEQEWIKGVVGWIDLQAPGVAEEALRLQQNKKLKGFRHVVQAEPDPAFMQRTAFVQGVQAIGKLGFTYDILIYPHQLRAAAKLVAQCSEQPFVLDHLAKPNIKNGEIEIWRKDIQRLGTYENVYAKLSGLITEADWQHWQPADLTPYLDTALEVFGPKRLMWGSDWPVCTLAGNYTSVLHSMQHYISTLSAAESASIMSETATSFYNL